MVFVAPNEMHQFVNSGFGVLRFICCIRDGLADGPKASGGSRRSRRSAARSCLYHEGGQGGAVVFVGGTDGGFDGPANGIYATLAEDLRRRA